MKKLSKLKLENEKKKYISLNGDKLNKEMAKLLGGYGASTDRACRGGCGATAAW